jgi:hypothetical protein
MSQCTAQVRHGRVYGDHLIDRPNGSCGIQKVFEPAPGVINGWEAVWFNVCGSVGRGNFLQVRSHQVEFS